MKKLLKKTLAVVASVVLVAFAATPAFAHGSHRGGQRAVSYSVCAVWDCTLSGLHSHDNETFASHYYGDGHDYHDYCGITSCTLTGYHEHDGTYCFGHSLNDGHSYHHRGGGHH